MRAGGEPYLLHVPVNSQPPVVVVPLFAWPIVSCSGALGQAELRGMEDGVVAAGAAGTAGMGQADRAAGWPAEIRGCSQLLCVPVEVWRPTVAAYSSGVAGNAGPGAPHPRSWRAARRPRENAMGGA